MEGTIIGNILAVLYYLIYQIGGIFLGFIFFRRQKCSVRILFGSIIGTFAIQWLPILFSFIFNFTMLSHVIAICIFTLFIGCVTLYLYKNQMFSELFIREKEYHDRDILTFIKGHAFLLVIIPAFVYFVMVLLTHTIPINQNGAITTGQCTYGDMNLHLAFITSIAKQSTFPPDYSLLPGTKLSYPFLSDSISSSLYIWNSSLRLAYMFPMFIAILQLFFGFYILAEEILKRKAKAILAWLLFFLNGGLGFVYFIDRLGNDTANFTRIFTEFYQTPTNYTLDGNIYWVNVIVDILIPQRATLFGWAMLFPILLLLYKAIRGSNKIYFVIAGVLAGGLPMIHTHSFLALGMICVIWLTYHMLSIIDKEIHTRRALREQILLIIGIALLCYLRYRHMLKGELPERFCMNVGVFFVLIFCIYCFHAVIKGWFVKEGKQAIVNWGIFLMIVLLLAIPQLFIWTFNQADGNGFLRGHFNWSNKTDLYLYFYLKNMGIMLLFVLASFFSGKKKVFMLGVPALFIWSVAEFIEFQPNDYDNNKLLLVGFVFLCFVAADYMINIFEKMKRLPWKYIAGGLVIFCCTFSALLTLRREYVSEYKLYSAEQVKLCEYIEDNTDTDSIILTSKRHNNAVAALTGRSIVCGAQTFLYFHGLDFNRQSEAVDAMYNDPVSNKNLLAIYNVDYIVVGPEEQREYSNLVKSKFDELFTCIYTVGGVSLYKVQ